MTSLTEGITSKFLNDEGTLYLCSRINYEHTYKRI